MWINSFTLILVTVIMKVDLVENVILDSRCYLEGGGSAESFLASEDTPVGSTIGRLHINGNPNLEAGDISLSLREKDTPVKILPGTKNLILIQPLDKEGVKGPSSIYVNVICDRRHSNDPSFVIPVNVRVTDVNDNAPQWIGAPYSIKLSEVTVPGTRILQTAKAVDHDQHGPYSTVEYQVLPGDYSEYVQFLNPLDGTLVLKKALDYEKLKNFTVRLRAQDQGIPPKFTDTFLRVLVIDADDQNPKFLHEAYYGELPLDGRAGELKILPQQIKAVDQDEGLCAPVIYSIMQSSETKYFRIDSKTGAISLVSGLQPTDITNSVTLVIKATQIDNPDRYALTTVKLTRPQKSITEMETLRFIKKKFVIRIREDTPVGTRILALPTNKPEKNLRYYIPNLLQAQYFTFGSLGELILEKPLDYEKQIRHVFEVVATDGITNATTEVDIEVIDVNDWEPRFRQSYYSFKFPRKEENQQDQQQSQSSLDTITAETSIPDRVKLGRIEVADGDINDKLEVLLKGQEADLFEIDPVGNLWMRTDVPVNKSIINLIAVATDSGVPPHSTSVPIAIVMDDTESKQSIWSASILGMFGSIVAILIVIVLVISCYVVKIRKKSRKGQNKIHSKDHHPTISPPNLMKRGEKISTVGGSSGIHALGNRNITMSNPINNNNHGGSGSSLSAGASTILAASLEREAQLERERQRQRDDYTATVRSIVSRASAALGAHNHLDTTSISNGEVPETTDYRDWPHDKTEPMSSSENLGPSENNLTVYF